MDQGVCVEVVQAPSKPQQYSCKVGGDGLRFGKRKAEGSIGDAVKGLPLEKARQAGGSFRQFKGIIAGLFVIPMQSGDQRLAIIPGALYFQVTESDTDGQRKNLHHQNGCSQQQFFTHGRGFEVCDDGKNIK